MITDIVCERIIKKKRGTKENVIAAALIITALALTAALVLVTLAQPAFGALAIAVIFGIIWGVVKLIGRQNIEYEYGFVNGELTVDKIINKSSRKPMVVLDVANIEKIGWYKEIPADAGDKRIDCAETKDPENGLYVCFKDGNGRAVVVVMNCDDKILAGMKRYIKPLVYREGLGNYNPSANLPKAERAAAPVIAASDEEPAPEEDAE